MRKSLLLALLAGAVSADSAAADDINQWQLLEDTFMRKIDTLKGEDGHNQLPPDIPPWKLLPPLFPQETKQDGYSCARAFLESARRACDLYANEVVGEPIDAEKRLGHYAKNTDRHDAEHLTKQLLKFALDARRGIEGFESNILEGGLSSATGSNVEKLLKDLFADDKDMKTLRDIQQKYPKRSQIEEQWKAKETTVRQNEHYVDEVNSIVSNLVFKLQRDILGVEQASLEEIKELVSKYSPIPPAKFLMEFDVEYLRNRLEESPEEYDKRNDDGLTINDFFPTMLNWFFPKLNIIVYGNHLSFGEYCEMHKWASDLRDKSRDDAGPFVFMYQVQDDAHWEYLALGPDKDTGSVDENLFNPSMAPHPALNKEPVPDKPTLPQVATDEVVTETSDAGPDSKKESDAGSFTNKKEDGEKTDDDKKDDRTETKKEDKKEDIKGGKKEDKKEDTKGDKKEDIKEDFNEDKKQDKKDVKDEKDKKSNDRKEQKTYERTYNPPPKASKRRSGRPSLRQVAMQGLKSQRSSSRDTKEAPYRMKENAQSVLGYFLGFMEVILLVFVVIVCLALVFSIYMIIRRSDPKGAGASGFLGTHNVKEKVIADERSRLTPKATPTPRARRQLTPNLHRRN